MKFILSTDSCCDYFKSDLEKMNVKYIPMAYISQGTEYRDNYDSNAEYHAFYDFLREGNLPSTTQLNGAELEEYLEGLLEANEGDLVHITLSAGLSGTFNSAVTAANEVMARTPDRKIYVVDSSGATQVQAYLVDRAAEDREQGKTAQETYEDVQDLAHRLNVIVMPRDLFHLHRGGRVSKVTAVVGSILQIKPMIQFSTGGHLVVTDKVKGWTKGLRAMAKYIIKMSSDLEHNKIYIAHADAIDDALELEALLREYTQADIKIGWIGPVIGSHTGPGALGAICIGPVRTVEKK